MRAPEKRYFRSTGKTLKAIQDWQQKQAQVMKEWKDFANRYGDAESWYTGRRLEGVKFKGEPPAGWVSTSRLPHGYYKPARRKPMAAYKEFNALPRGFEGHDLLEMLGIAFLFHGMSMYTCSFKSVGDQIILILHEGQGVPEGAVPLKASEYHLLMEQQEEESA